MMKLSVVIITFNEEKNIQRCLDSVKKVADEIIVLDSFSTDKTQIICKKFGAKFLQHAFDGHIQQKNRAMHLASNDMVLSLDADEALSPELEKSILEFKKANKTAACSMNRLNNYCGQWIKHGGWYPDRKVRIWNKNQGQWGGTNPHDKVVLGKGISVKHLYGDLLHYSYYSLAEHLKQTEKFNRISAQEMVKSGYKPTFTKLFLSPYFKFFKDYILKTGFLDGKNGFTIAKISAKSVYDKYRLVKTIEINSTNDIG